MSTSSTRQLPRKVIIAAGTYDGVLAGWELNKKGKLAISFASPVHGGSVRSLAMANSNNNNNNNNNANRAQDDDVPGSLLSCGYDEMLRTHDFSRRLTSSGEVRTPDDFGTPVCSSFAPPAMTGGAPPPSTHCLVGFSGGKLVIYKKRDWSIQHVLAGHEGGMASLAVHPTGKMALSGGQSDGKIKLWDLTKGRLAYVSKLHPASTSVRGRTHYDPVVSLVWSPVDGSAYALACGSHVTVRDVATGKDLLDAELPSRINQICLLKVLEGLFVAAACNDGSLPVLAVQNIVDGEAEQERRAIMAIEPVDGPVAGEERFKCIQTVSDYHVATCNSAGVISLMNLQGAVNMIMAADNDDNQNEEESPVHPESDDDDGDEKDIDEEEELAVDIIDSIRLGTGARITCLAAWSSPEKAEPAASDSDSIAEEEEEQTAELKQDKDEEGKKSKLKRKRDGEEVVMDDQDLKKARALVSKAKKIQKRKHKKKKAQLGK